MEREEMKEWEEMFVLTTEIREAQSWVLVFLVDYYWLGYVSLSTSAEFSVEWEW